MGYAEKLLTIPSLGEKRMKRRDFLLSTGAVLAASTFPCRWIPAAEGKRRKVLYYTCSVGFEHSPVKRTGSELGFSEKVLAELGAKNGFDVTCTKDGRLFDTDLDKYDVIAFYTCGDLTKQDKYGNPPMTPAGKQKLLDAIAAGKGFVGFHSANDSFHSQGPRDENQAELDPYIAMLGGRVHCARTAAGSHGANHLDGLPRRKGDWRVVSRERGMVRDAELAPDMHVIQVLDTQGMVDACYQRPPFPFTSAQRHQKGRVWYTGFGHREDIWTNPKIQALILGGLAWTAGNVEFDVPANIDKVAPVPARFPSFRRRQPRRRPRNRKPRRWRQSRIVDSRPRLCGFTKKKSPRFAWGLVRFMAFQPGIQLELGCEVRISRFQRSVLRRTAADGYSSAYTRVLSSLVTGSCSSSVCNCTRSRWSPAVSPTTRMRYRVSALGASRGSPSNCTRVASRKLRVGPSAASALSPCGSMADTRTLVAAFEPWLTTRTSYVVSPPFSMGSFTSTTSNLMAAIPSTRIGCSFSTATPRSARPSRRRRCSPASIGSVTSSTLSASLAGSSASSQRTVLVEASYCPALLARHELQPARQVGSQFDLPSRGRARVGDGHGIRGLAFEEAAFRSFHGHVDLRGDDFHLAAVFDAEISFAVGHEDIRDHSGANGRERELQLPLFARLQRAHLILQLRAGWML